MSIGVHHRLALRLLLVCLGMFGFGFALVPLYDAFCQATGFNGRGSGRVPAADAFAAQPRRSVRLELVANVNTAAHWRFGPQVTHMTIHPGVPYSTRFHASNPSDREHRVQAVASVAPGRAAAYLQKIECFCFRGQDFAPGETRELPLRFVLDPALPADVHTLTLAYTLFDASDSG